MRLDELGEVHPVDVIAGEDQVVLGIDVAEVPRRLAHGVGRALKPLFALGRLLGGQDLDEAAREHVHPVGLRDVAVERRRVELRQHVDAFEAGVQAVAERNVDQPVLAADRHRRLRAMVREREQPRAAAAAEHDRQHVVHSPFILWHRRALVPFPFEVVHALRDAARPSEASPASGTATHGFARAQASPQVRRVVPR